MARRKRTWPVIVTLVAAIALEMVPLPDLLQPIRPPFTLLVLIYWVMMWPERFELTAAFLIGLGLDILHGQLLGQNALVYSVVTYLTLLFHLQIRIFPLWQLTVTVFALLSASSLLTLMIEGMAGLSFSGFASWARILSGTLFWPLIMGFMDKFRMQVEHRETAFN
ncbi:MAG: rod shape-determining protein MreD [Gammaproteobacteria bacterium]